jgi:hypothetical protein
MSSDSPSLFSFPEGIKDQTAPGFTGSVFINNNSYSGCDIKVLVHIYDDGKISKGQKESLEKQLDETLKSLQQAQRDASELISEIPEYKQGTDALTRKTRVYNQTRSRISILSEVVQSIQDRLRLVARDAPKSSTKVLAECQTLSLSTFRDKQAVRACGSVYPKGFIRSQREIAGSLIFTVFNQHVFYDLMEAHISDFDGTTYTSAVMDQLPPLDIIIAFANEYGHLSRMEIYGVEFVSDGMTMSIEDILTENVCNYVARDYNPMRAVAAREIDKVSQQLQASMSMRASDLLLEEDYKIYKNASSPFQRLNNRRNPFL